MSYTIATHAIAGMLVLVLGLVAIFARKRRRGAHGRAGRAYVVLMLVVCVGGLIIGARDPALSPFEIAVAPTLGPLLIGTYAVRRKGRILGRHWLTWHIGGMGGSFIGVVTAGGFQSLARLLPDTAVTTTAIFAVPAIAGTLLISRTIERRVATAPGRPTAAAAA